MLVLHHDMVLKYLKVMDIHMDLFLFKWIYLYFAECLVQQWNTQPEMKKGNMKLQEAFLQMSSSVFW